MEEPSTANSKPPTVNSEPRTVNTSAELRLQRILVPTDFSASAEHALKYAVSLSKPFKATIFVLHVFHLQEYLALLSERDQVDSGTASEVLEAAKGRAANKLEELVSRSEGEQAAVLPILLVGVPFEEIVRYAAEHEVDLIVMPTRGRTGVAHLFLGSTAERVISHSVCPVLVVRTRPRGQGN